MHIEYSLFFHFEEEQVMLENQKGVRYKSFLLVDPSGKEPAGNFFLKVY